MKDHCHRRIFHAIILSDYCGPVRLLSFLGCQLLEYIKEKIRTLSFLKAFFINSKLIHPSYYYIASSFDNSIIIKELLNHFFSIFLKAWVLKRNPYTKFEQLLLCCFLDDSKIDIFSIKFWTDLITWINLDKVGR